MKIKSLKGLLCIAFEACTNSLAYNFPVLAQSSHTHPEGEAIGLAIATNFSSGTGTGDAKTAGASTIAGPYSADREQSEKGVVNLHNNPDVPDSNAQETLPNTDPIGLTIDPEANHQE